MSLKEFFTKLNSLAKYTRGLANSKQDQLDVFMGKLRLDIAKDVIMEDNSPKTFSKALDQVLISKTIRQWMTRDKKLSIELAQSQLPINGS